MRPWRPLQAQRKCLKRGVLAPNPTEVQRKYRKSYLGVLRGFEAGQICLLGLVDEGDFSRPGVGLTEGYFGDLRMPYSVHREAASDKDDRVLYDDRCGLVTDVAGAKIK
jgi:hypothetical protein